MNFLLDTNVVSEWTKPSPNPGLSRWLGEVDEDRVFLSVVTLAELRHGIERLPQGSRRRRLDEWVREDLSLRFEGRVLVIDEQVADTWGRLIAARAGAGRPLGAMDAFIAATATVHSMALVTRNVADFAASLDEIIDPWTQA